jgi:hypothetical protein
MTLHRSIVTEDSEAGFWQENLYWIDIIDVQCLASFGAICQSFALELYLTISLLSSKLDLSSLA